MYNGQIVPDDCPKMMSNENDIGVSDPYLL